MEIRVGHARLRRGLGAIFSARGGTLVHAPLCGSDYESAEIVWAEQHFCFVVVKPIEIGSLARVLKRGQANTATTPSIGVG
jgi:hypothetical protein